MVGTSAVHGIGFPGGAALPAAPLGGPETPDALPVNPAGRLDARQVREVLPERATGPVSPPDTGPSGDEDAGAIPLAQRETRLLQAPEPYLRALDPRMAAILSTLEDGETERDVNWNCKAHFKDTGEEIACRHLAIAVWEARSKYLQAKQAGASPGRFSYADLASVERIEATVDPATEALYDAIIAQSDNSHLVLASRWGEFLDDQFKTLKPGEHRHVLVFSVYHVMLAELQLKQKAGQPPYRVVMFYDPNQTLTHQRVILDGPGTRACRLGTFLDDDALADYFPSAPGQRLARVIALDPADLGDAVSSGPKRSDTKSQPASVTYASPWCSASELQLRVCDGLHAGLAQRLNQTLAACGAQQALDLLQAQTEKGEPLLAHALAKGDAAMVQVLVDAIQGCAPLLQPAQRLELLLARDAAGRPGLMAAIQSRWQEAATVLVEALLQPDSHWSEEDLACFMVGIRADGQEDWSLAKDPAFTCAGDRLRNLLTLPSEVVAG
jgi:hypothetical protein